MDVDMVDTSHEDSFEAQSQSFIDWAIRNGTNISAKLTIVDYRSDHRGRGVAAVKDIEEDEELFTIPRSTILGPRTSRLTSEVNDVPQEPWLALILTLVYEHQKGSSSSWKPYFDILPQHFDSLMFWSEEELALLKGSAVINKIGKDKADTAFTTQVVPFIRQHEAAFAASNLSDSDLQQLCHLMASTIMAYAFDMEKVDKDKEQGQTEPEDGWEEDSEDGEPLPIEMVPLADMLNADADRNNAKLFYEEDKVVMRSIRAIPTGEEIFNDYGLIPTADLARRYGYFTTNYAQYDVVEISQEQVRSVANELFKLSDSQFHDRMDHLETEMSTDAFDIAHPTAEDGQFPIELIGVLRCLALSPPEFDKMRTKGKMPSDKPLHAEEPQVIAALQAILNHRISLYESGQLISVDMTYRQQMAHAIVQGEKAVISQAFETLKAMQPTQSTTNSRDQKKRKK